MNRATLFAVCPLLAAILDHEGANNFRMVYNELPDNMGDKTHPPMLARHELDFDGQTAECELRRTGYGGIRDKEGTNVIYQTKAEFDCDGKTGKIDNQVRIDVSAANGVEVFADIDITLPGKLPATVIDRATGKRFGDIVEMKGLIALFADYTIDSIHPRELAGCDPDIRFSLNDKARETIIRDAHIAFLKIRHRNP